MLFSASLISVYAISLALAHPPASTTLQLYGTENGWSPRPTTNPNDHPLARRQLVDDSVCGYVGGIRTSSVTCPGFRSCFFNSRISAAGCCYSATDSPVECGQYTSCVPRSESASCTGACASDPLVAVCGILNPECFTYEFPGGYKNIGCGPTAGSESAEFTYAGQRTAGSFSSRVQTAAASATADDEDSRPSFTFGLTRSTSTSSSSSEAEDDDSSTSVSYSSGRKGRKGRGSSSGGRKGKKGGMGGIIGGIVAALIILSTIVSLILFFIKKRKQQKQQPVAAVYQQPQFQGAQPQASQVSQAPLQQYQQPMPQYPVPAQQAYYEVQQPVKAEYSGGQAQGYYQQPVQTYPAQVHQ